jgi:hypothetical protein
MGSTIDEALAIGEALVNHLALPPQLPQCQDREIEKVEAALTDRLINAAKLMRDLPGNPRSLVWDSVYRSLEAGKSAVVNHRLEKFSLVRALQNLANTEYLVVYIRNQNAAVLIYPAS